VELLTAQDGLIATWQPGAPDGRAMLRAHRQGHWQQVTTWVYSASPNDPNETQKAWAAVLHHGPDAVLSGRNALVLSGWNGGADEHMDVLVGRDCRRRGPEWIRPHRQGYTPRLARNGVPRAVIQAAAIDAAAWATSERQAVFFILSVLQQQLSDVPQLLRVLEDRPKLPRRRLILDTIADFSKGITTMGERDFANICTEYGIREPDRQVRRRDADGRFRYLDAYFEAERVVVEIDGLGHLALEIWLDDQVRQNERVIAGDRTFLRTSNVALKWEPWVTMDQLRRALGIYGY
jgi:hypothetical protein